LNTTGGQGALAREENGGILARFASGPPTYFNVNGKRGRRSGILTKRGRAGSDRSFAFFAPGAWGSDQRRFFQGGAAWDLNLWGCFCPKSQGARKSEERRFPWAFMWAHFGVREGKFWFPTSIHMGEKGGLWKIYRTKGGVAAVFLFRSTEGR